MTDKERLGTLKKNREWTEATGGKFYTVDSDDYKWLIKQAERVQELESDSYNAHLERLLDRKEQEIERYREALEFYAEPKNWLPQNEDVLSLITMDYGEKARKVLEGEE